MSDNKDISKIKLAIASEASKTNFKNIPRQDFTFEIAPMAMVKPHLIARITRRIWHWNRLRIWILRRPF